MAYCRCFYIEGLLVILCNYLIIAGFVYLCVEVACGVVCLFWFGFFVSLRFNLCITSLVICLIYCELVVVVLML